MKPPTCETCRFWNRAYSSGSGRIGECRRRSPKPVLHRDRPAGSIWPPTDPQDWCGEHQPLPDVPAPTQAKFTGGVFNDGLPKE